MTIIESLRAAAAKRDCPNPLAQEEAADEISRLQAENERLREALKEIANDPTGVSIAQAEIAKDALTSGKSHD